MSRTTLWRVLAVALPVLGALVAPLPTVDLAYQLRAGGEILDAGAIPTVDTWTFTVAGTPWLDQQWGAQVLLALVYRLGGWTGLVLLRAALVGLALGLLLFAIRRRAPGLGPRLAALVVIGAFIVSAFALALRPQLFAIVLFAATLALLAIRHERSHIVWLIPILAAVWANLHGTFPLVAALCGLAWLGDLAEAPRSPVPGLVRHRMLLVGLAAAAATAITPFGPAVWSYVANLASNPVIVGRVSEWQPPSLLTVPGAILWLSLAFAAVVLVVHVRLARRIPWPAALTLLVFGAFAAITGRGTAWWPFVAAFVIAPWLAPASGRATATTAAAERPAPLSLRRLNVGIVAALSLVGIGLLPMWRPVGAAGVPERTISYAPQVLAEALETFQLDSEDPPRPRVWNPQTWGSWFELAAPKYAYALDSRIELFPASVWDDADAVAAGDLSVLDRFDVDIVLTDHKADARLEAALRLAPDAWSEVIADCDGSLWFRVSVFPLEPQLVGCPPRSLVTPLGG